jgi:hypothetical protein
MRCIRSRTYPHQRPWRLKFAILRPLDLQVNKGCLGLNWSWKIAEDYWGCEESVIGLKNIKHNGTPLSFCPGLRIDVQSWLWNTQNTTTEYRVHKDILATKHVYEGTPFHLLKSTSWERGGAKRLSWLYSRNILLPKKCAVKALWVKKLSHQQLLQFPEASTVIISIGQMMSEKTGKRWI